MVNNGRLTNRIAPEGIKHVLALLTTLAGLGLVLGLSVVDGSLDRSIRLGALVAGGVLTFVGMSLDSMFRFGTGSVDEREAQILYRASYVALIGNLVTYGTLSIGFREDIISLSATEVLQVVAAATFGTLFVAQWVYRWLM